MASESREQFYAERAARSIHDLGPSEEAALLRDPEFRERVIAAYRRIHGPEATLEIEARDSGLFYAWWRPTTTLYVASPTLVEPVQRQIELVAASALDLPEVAFRDHIAQLLDQHGFVVGLQRTSSDGRYDLIGCKLDVRGLPAKVIILTDTHDQGRFAVVREIHDVETSMRIPNALAATTTSSPVAARLGFNNRADRKRIIEFVTQAGPMPSSYEYDLVMSFAGEDRALAEAIRNALSSKFRIFYDTDHQAPLWGKELYTHFYDIYCNKARYCLMIISAHYLGSRWASHERMAAQARAFQESREYIIPLRLDDTQVPGLSPTIGYIDLRDTPVERIVELLERKLASHDAE